MPATKPSSACTGLDTGTGLGTVAGMNKINSIITLPIALVLAAFILACAAILIWAPAGIQHWLYAAAGVAATLVSGFMNPPGQPQATGSAAAVAVVDAVIKAVENDGADQGPPK